MVKNMFCKNCGKPLPDGTKFCTACGTQLAAAQPAAPVEATPVVTTPAQVTAVEAPAQVTAPVVTAVVTAPSQDTATDDIPVHDATGVVSENGEYFAQADFEAEAAIKKKKKKKKAILLSTISIVLVVAIALPLFLIFGKKNDNLMSVAMDTLFTLNSNVEMSEKAKALANLYGAMIEASEEGSEVELSLNASDTVIGMIEGALGASGTKMDLDWIKDTVINYHYDMSGEIGSVGGAVTIDGDEIINVEAIIDSTTNTLFFGIPTLTDTYLSQTIDHDEMRNVTTEAFSMYQSMLSAGGATEFLPTGDELVNIIDNYADIIDECFQHDKESDITLNVNGIRQDVTMFTMDVTDRDLLNAAIEILELAKDDQDILDVLEKMETFFVEQDLMSKSEASMITNEFVSSVTTTILDAKDALSDCTGEVLFSLVRYVDDDNMIVGRDLSVEDEQVLYHATAIDGDDYASILEMSNMCIEGKGTIDGDAKTGDYVIYASDNKVLEYALKDFKLNDYGPNGSVIVYLPDEAMERLGANDTISSYLSGMKVGIELKFESTKNSFGFELNVVTGSEVLIGCGIKFSDYSGKTSAPTDSVSFENADKWLKTIDVAEVLDKLSDTAIGDIINEYAADITDLLSGDNFFLPSYDYDDYEDWDDEYEDYYDDYYDDYEDYYEDYNENFDW